MDISCRLSVGRSPGGRLRSAGRCGWMVGFVAAYLAAYWAACRMMSATACGWEIIEQGPAGIARCTAPNFLTKTARSSGGMAWSRVATNYQVGLSRHAATLTGVDGAAADDGLWFWNSAAFSSTLAS